MTLYKNNQEGKGLNWHILALVVLLCAGLEELAQFPNVYCKVSGMFATDPKWDKRSVETVAKPCLELFGMDR